MTASRDHLIASSRFVNLGNKIIDVILFLDGHMTSCSRWLDDGAHVQRLQSAQTRLSVGLSAVHQPILPGEASAHFPTNINILM